MEKYLDIMKSSTDLAETISEGLQHFQKLFGEGRFEQSLFLFEDILEAYSAIERSVNSIIEAKNPENLKASLKSVNHALSIVVDTYEDKKYMKVQEVLQFTLIPQFNRLKAEAFSPYLLS